jgi:probable rRNA maturation factor
VIELVVVLEGGEWPQDGSLAALAEAAANATFAVAPDAPADPVFVTLLLTDDASIRELNRLWRGQDKATNVLSFPAEVRALPGEPRQLGDIALAHETLAREAEDEGKSLRAHFAHLVVHGLLHLIGRDHADGEEADDMERLEAAALARLGIADPYGGEAVAPPGALQPTS